MIYECLYDFLFKNMDSGLYCSVKKGERYKLENIDKAENKVHLKSEDSDTELYLSVYKFASAFVEAK